MRILILKSSLLHPLNNGGRIRTYHTLRHLMREHHIAFMGLDEPGASDPDAHRLASEYCHELIAVPHHPPHPKGSFGLYVELAQNLFSDLQRRRNGQH